MIHFSLIQNVWGAVNRFLGCQVLVNEKSQTLFKKRKMLDFTIINFYRLKKGQLLNKLSKT